MASDGTIPVRGPAALRRRCLNIRETGNLVKPEPCCLEPRRTIGVIRIHAFGSHTLTPPVIRILFLADTHLGFDLPARPRIERRRRGHDFVANYERALQAARDLAVHAVVHGGDVFYRSRVPASLVQAGFAPLKRLADSGVPVYVVPGNHERSAIPFRMLAEHPRIHIFDRPRTFTAAWNGIRVGLAGFPFERAGVRDAFPGLVADTGWEAAGAEVNLLCIHQCIEGARVGPQNYTFRHADDVVRGADIPAGFAAVLAGHIHRHQVLTADLAGRPLAAPVIYPGSIERTSFAERDEEKGYVVLDVEVGPTAGGVLRDWTFHRLPARPMVIADIDGAGTGQDHVRRLLAEAIRRAPADAVLQLRVHGVPAPDSFAALRAAAVRALAPATMNVEVVLVDVPRPRRSAD
jgi:DNA repair protein SbcD/Mre11